MNEPSLSYPPPPPAPCGGTRGCDRNRHITSVHPPGPLSGARTLTDSRMRTLVVLLVLTTCCCRQYVSVSAQLRHHTREPVKDDDVSLENALELYRAAKDVVNPTTHELWRNESLGLGSPPPPAYYRNISAADDREDLGVFLDELRTFKGLGLHSDNVQKKKYSPPMPPYAQPPRPPEPPTRL